MDTACVELKFSDGSMIAIDTIAVENEVADNMYQRSELDYLICNDPLAYAALILCGNLKAYLKKQNTNHLIDLHTLQGKLGACFQVAFWCDEFRHAILKIKQNRI